MAKILLVDDMEPVRKAIIGIMKYLKHEVDEVENVNQAVIKLQQNKYDLVITDMVMPDGGGKELITYMNKLGQRPKILAISGGSWHLNAIIELDPIIMMADATLSKPFGREELEAALNKVLPATPVAA